MKNETKKVNETLENTNNEINYRGVRKMKNETKNAINAIETTDEMNEAIRLLKKVRRRINKPGPRERVEYDGPIGYKIGDLVQDGKIFGRVIKITKKTLTVRKIELQYELGHYLTDGPGLVDVEGSGWCQEWDCKVPYLKNIEHFKDDHWPVVYRAGNIPRTNIPKPFPDIVKEDEVVIRMVRHLD